MTTTTPTDSPTAQHQAIEKALNAALFLMQEDGHHAIAAALLTAQRAVQLLESAYADSQAKRFATLQAQFALLGHTLHQSGPGDGPGPVSYMAEKWGMARYLPTLDDADKLLTEIGRAGHG